MRQIGFVGGGANTIEIVIHDMVCKILSQTGQRHYRKTPLFDDSRVAIFTVNQTKFAQQLSQNGKIATRDRFIHHYGHYETYERIRSATATNVYAFPAKYLRFYCLKKALHTSSQTNFKTTRQKENARSPVRGLVLRLRSGVAASRTLWTGIDKRGRRGKFEQRTEDGRERSTTTLGGFKERNK